MNVLLVKPENEEQMKAVKAILKVLNIDFVSKKDKEYNEAFVTKIEESRKQSRQGKTTSVKLEDLWK